MTLRFRVSGQGKRMFGDGFALWVTQDGYHKDGALHGYADTFTGFGIIFDTFVNTEPGHVHKDIALVTNDGTQSRAAPNGAAVDPQGAGCDANFRFHEGRDDFNPSKARSAARIHFDSRQRAVTVEVDAKNTGEWVKCIDRASVDLPQDWHKTAHIGMTATTGQLADNHDVISLGVIEGNGVTQDHAETEDAPAMISTGEPRLDTAAQTAAAREAAKVKKELLDLHHELEHSLDKVTDGLKHTIKKLTEAEKKVEERVDQLEARLRGSLADEVQKHVGQSVERHVDQKLGDSVRSSVDSAVRAAQRGADASGSAVRDIKVRMQSQIDELRDIAAGSSKPWSAGTWVVVVLVAALVVGVVVMLYMAAMSGGRRRGGSLIPGLGTRSKDHFL